MGIKIHKVYATKWYATLIVCYNKRLFCDSYCVGKGEVKSSILFGSTSFSNNQLFCIATRAGSLIHLHTSK